jgi:hypothetical protein
MNQIRARVSTHLGKFINVIAIDLPKAYGLALRGSWAYGEYHAIEKDGIIRSCSDVDFVRDVPHTSTERIQIEKTLYKAAASCGLELRGISIRSADEMRNMWALGGHACDNDKCRKNQSEFIQFWILIGAAEVYAAWLRSDDNVPCGQYYYMNKFFLGIWRDLGIIWGQNLRSYLETLLFAARSLSPDICSASYALKLGIETTIPWFKLQSAHQSSIITELSCFIRSTKEYERICNVVNNLTRLDRRTAKSQALGLLDSARALEGGLISRKAARARLFQKITQGVT